MGQRSHIRLSLGQPAPASRRLRLATSWGLVDLRVACRTRSASAIILLRTNLGITTKETRRRGIRIIASVSAIEGECLDSRVSPESQPPPPPRERETSAQKHAATACRLSLLVAPWRVGRRQVYQPNPPSVGRGPSGTESPQPPATIDRRTRFKDGRPSRHSRGPHSQSAQGPLYAQSGPGAARGPNGASPSL